jgi:hypothetical protein
MIESLSPRKLSQRLAGTHLTKTQPFCISKNAVGQAYRGIKANKAGAGIELGEFEKDLTPNLYRIWNRMSWGSYMPPAVLLVEIPKQDGSQRPLGIPRIADPMARGARPKWWLRWSWNPRLIPFFTPILTGIDPINRHSMRWEKPGRDLGSKTE